MNCPQAIYQQQSIFNIHNATISADCMVHFCIGRNRRCQVIACDCTVLYTSSSILYNALFKISHRHVFCGRMFILFWPPLKLPHAVTDFTVGKSCLCKGFGKAAFYVKKLLLFLVEHSRTTYFKTAYSWAHYLSKGWVLPVVSEKN